MKKVLLLTFIACKIVFPTQCQDLDWIKSGASVGNINWTINGMEGAVYSLAEKDGTLYAAGFLGSTQINFGDTILNASAEQDRSMTFLASYNHDGTLNWARRTEGGISPTLAVDQNGDVYNSAHELGTGITTLSKYNKQGALIWDKQIRFLDINSISVDHENNCIVAGKIFNSGTAPIQVLDTLVTTGYGTSLYVMKLDPSGNLKWFRRGTGYATASTIRSIDIGSTNDIFFIGDFRHAVDDSLALGEIVLHAKTDDGYPRQDIVLGQLNKDGQFVWAKSMGGDDDDWGNKIKVDGDDNAYFTGTFIDSLEVDGTYHYGKLYEILLGKVSKTDSIHWIKTAGGPRGDYYTGYDAGRALCVADDGIYFGGSFNTLAVFGEDDHAISVTSDNHWSGAAAFLAKYEEDGNVSWVVHGGHGESDIFDMVSAGERIYFGGNFASFVATEPVIFDDEDIPSFNTSAYVKNFMIGSIGGPPVVDPPVTGLPLEENATLALYPNPTSGTVVLKNISGDNIVAVKIVDSFGHTVRDIKTGRNNRDHFEIDVSDLQAGVYVMIVERGNKIEALKFVKQF